MCHLAIIIWKKSNLQIQIYINISIICYWDFSDDMSQPLQAHSQIWNMARIVAI